MDDKLSKRLTGFRKSHGTQHLLLTMLEKCKKAVDKGECVSTLFLNLSKAFETVNHDLLRPFTEGTKINALLRKQ